MEPDLDRPVGLAHRPHSRVGAGRRRGTKTQAASPAYAPRGVQSSPVQACNSKPVVTALARCTPPHTHRPLGNVRGCAMSGCYRPCASTSARIAKSRRQRDRRGGHMRTPLVFTFSPRSTSGSRHWRDPPSGRTARDTSAALREKPPDLPQPMGLLHHDSVKPQLIRPGTRPGGPGTLQQTIQHQRGRPASCRTMEKEGDASASSAEVAADP